MSCFQYGIKGLRIVIWSSLPSSALSEMFPAHQSRVEMAYFDHDYTTKYPSHDHDSRLHTNLSHSTEQYLNRRIDPRYNCISVHMPSSVQNVRTEQILRHQHHVTNPYANCDGFQMSTNHRSEINQIVPNKSLYDVSESYSADTYQAQQLVRGTLEPYLRFHSQGRTHHEKTTQHRTTKTITKRKSRTVFNTQQILILEKIFKKKPYVSREERQLLVEMLNVNDRVIKVWFQNRRRLSGASQKEEPIDAYSDTSNEEIDTTLNLSYVESKIKDADEFGYVTLDDKAMNELITVVDTFLPDIDLNEPVNSNVEFPVDPIKYEPISPVSIDDYDDDVSYMPQWEPNEPEVSLRHLFDVQALMSA